jgi:antitoxin component of RelBE/YafQ-DinJ toxin-antitoxin module
MSWKAAYQEDKQAKLETRISRQNKQDFIEVCDLLDMKPSDLLRQLVNHVIKEYETELAVAREQK